MIAKKISTKVHWDVGTAYELFVSLHVLHAPEKFGLRASWAAGIRSRIPAAERKFLEEVMPFLSVPMPWISTLSDPKDSVSVLWQLRQIEPANRMLEVHIEEREFSHVDIIDIIKNIVKNESYTEAEFQTLSRKFTGGKHEHTEVELRRFLDWWTRPAEFGEMYLASIQAYHQSFFAEEEKRVAPILQAGLEHGRELASKLDVPDLLAELSQGVRMDDLNHAKELLLVPAFWITPLILFDFLDNGRAIVLYGARPATMSAIPGGVLPDGLLNALKALADPTRLKILHYIAQEPHTPSRLAKRLRLRAPTVTHHLSELRLAGLVNMTMEGQEKKYTARFEALQATFITLQDFLKMQEEKV
jgi:DNA-binding transcriptional ArsR family regulator